MELIIINKTYLKDKKEPVRKRTIYINRNTISFSRGSFDFLQLNSLGKVNFATDAKKPKTTYITKTQPDDDAAFVVSPCKKGGIIRSMELCAKLLSPFKMNKLTFMVSVNPEKIGECEYYQMLPMESQDIKVNKTKNTRGHEKYEL
jgi:hypothetical protein